jgi:hypothetical protein
MKPTVEDFEAIELAAAMLGKPEPETDDATRALEDECIDRFGVDPYQLAEIASHLLPLCEHGTAALSGASVRGFAKDGAFICKMYD